MRRPIFWTCLGLLVACGGGEKREHAETGSMQPGPVDMKPGPVDMKPGPVVMQPGPPPGGNPPGACHNVVFPRGSSCRLAGLWPQNCPDCGEKWRSFHSSHFVTVGGVEYGFESGAFRVPADREKEFKTFMQKHSPAPCGGVIIRPPCNPSATHVKLELTWPDWVVHERM